MVAWGRCARLGLLGAAALAGLSAGCQFTLDRGVSCGDGWWDVDYEQCDPTDPGSFVDACRELDPRFDVDAECDRSSCTLMATIDSCNRCGDGVIAGDEVCEGSELPSGAACPEGMSGPVGCSACALDYSGCVATTTKCGNGQLDPGEECDPELDCDVDAHCPAASPVCDTELGECMPEAPGGGPANSCAEYEVTAWNHGKTQPAYTYGTVGRCTQDCVFDREVCNFCGDGELDDDYKDLGWPDIEYEQPAEICDGDADPGALSQACLDYCPLSDPPTPDLELRCGYTGCSDDCQAIELDYDGEDVAQSCCIRSGVPCVADEGALGLPCCYWLDVPNAWGQCSVGISGPVCPSVGGDTPLAPGPSG